VIRQTAIACLALFAVAPLATGDVYVSPRGSDANAGTREKPFATLQKALAAVRGAGPATVWLAEGEYRLTHGAALDGKHSGAKGAPLTIRSEAAHKARISGARVVTGFQPIGPDAAKTLISEEARKNVLVADLKQQGFPPLGKLPDAFRAPGCEEVIFGDMPSAFPSSDFARSSLD